MTPNSESTALIVGAGAGLSASFARKLAAQGVRIALAARNTEKLGPLATETHARVFPCDAAKAADVARLFASVQDAFAAPDIVLYNPSARARGPIAELDPDAVADALATTAYGGFLVGQQAARAMLPRKSGTILFTGASASIKGFARSASFAMGKFALRGLAQSMARELAPEGIHVAHVIVDGAIAGPKHPDPPDGPDSRLEADAIADAFMHLIAQPRSAWTHELDIRPWSERF